jgi:hypothetical protein
LIFNALAEEVRAIYALSSDSDWRDGKWHDLRVKTSHPGLQLRVDRNGRNSLSPRSNSRGAGDQLGIEPASISIVVIVIISFFFVVFRRKIQFDRIEADDFQHGLTLFATDAFSLVHVFVNVDFRFALRTSC